MNEEHKRLVQLSWQERVKAIAHYHQMRCKEDIKHTIAQTASELNRSIGRVSEDLTLADWMKSHSRVEKFKNPRQALDWIKQKKRKMRVGDL